MPKMRIGKTRKDHESGAHARRIANRQARAAWNNSRDSAGKMDPFPVSACNGKRNRHRVTGKKGETVFLK